MHNENEIKQARKVTVRDVKMLKIKQTAFRIEKENNEPRKGEEIFGEGNIIWDKGINVPCSFKVIKSPAPEIDL